VLSQLNKLCSHLLSRLLYRWLAYLLLTVRTIYTQLPIKPPYLFSSYPLQYTLFFKFSVYKTKRANNYLTTAASSSITLILLLISSSKNSFRRSSGVYSNITKYIMLARLSRSKHSKTANEPLLSIASY